MLTKKKNKKVESNRLLTVRETRYYLRAIVGNGSLITIGARFTRSLVTVNKHIRLRRVQFKR